MSAVNEIHAAGGKLLISAGGASEEANWLNEDPTAYGRSTCSYIKSLDVDGVDFDKEGVAWDNKEINDWTDKAVKACREVWPEVFMTAAPQAPYFNKQASAGYSYADGLNHGAGFNKYLIQFYNQWPAYESYEEIFTNTNAPSISTIFKEFPNVPRKETVATSCL